MLICLQTSEAVGQILIGIAVWAFFGIMSLIGACYLRKHREGIE